MPPTKRLLDLFCGEGGAAKGYARAGFKVFGIDNSTARLGHYPYPHDSADALAYAAAHGHEYDLIHASPPCTGYTIGTAGVPHRLDKYERLIPATRDLLVELRIPYIIENVVGARREMLNPVLLCGRMFKLGTHDLDGTFLVLDRHRYFESNLPLHTPKHPVHHRGRIPVGGSYGGGRNDRAEARYERRGGYTPTIGVRRKLLDTGWMTQEGCSLAIPPAYTEYLGKQAIKLLAQGYH
jgi:DNA (cytosine-5)-methyltransferase 1